MRRDQHKIEDTYVVDDDTQLPELERLPGVEAVRPGEVRELEATYFDTADLTLAQAGITLRRRTGGPDQGWHLELPLKRGRLEVREPLSRAAKTVPKALRDLLVAHVRDETLQPVAIIRTRRQVHLLLDEEGTVLAEFCDDRVSATVAGDREPMAWREWEIELHHGRGLLEEAARVAVGAGGRPASTSELARALGDRVPVQPRRVLPRPTRKGPASHVAQARMSTQLGVLRGYDPLVRRDAPDAVHKMRVSVRRVRNALTTYRPLFVAEQTEPVRAELKWLAAALGEPRDVEVMRARLVEMLEAEAPAVLRGVEPRRIDEAMRTEYQEAHARLLEALSSERYLTLLDRLEELAVSPPWSERAAEPVGTVLRARRDYKRLASRMQEAEAAEGPDARADLLHEARKAAKRVRYAVEPLAGLYGDDAEAFVATMKRLQSLLGEHHDSAVTQERLRELSDEAAERGENAFAFGVLHARAERAQREIDEAFVSGWNLASRKKNRRWLRA